MSIASRSRRWRQCVYSLKVSLLEYPQLVPLLLFYQHFLIGCIGLNHSYSILFILFLSLPEQGTVEEVSCSSRESRLLPVGSGGA